MRRACHGIGSSLWQIRGLAIFITGLFAAHTAETNWKVYRRRLPHLCIFSAITWAGSFFSVVGGVYCHIWKWNRIVLLITLAVLIGLAAAVMLSLITKKKQEDSR
ncbi:MAG: hypothetical protein E6330_06880 [Dialister sp.]|nr:hypothetical protein [Dialister sp.]MDU5889628.1 hypothetical protein [Dialister sp.]MDU7053631.1 hypothetical protein [Dialister sp.]MDU7216833.1 hypothetical protein [Dialister sp.]